MLFRREISFFLLIAFTFISVPKELIHELHHHEDNLHLPCSFNSGGTNLTEEHIHCEYLNLQVQPFSFSYNFISEITSYSYSVFLIAETNSFPFPHKEIISPRGPPFIV